MSTLARGLLIVILIVPLVAINAWGLQTIWNWYIPSIFQLPVLEFNTAVGLALIITYTTHQQIIHHGEKTEGQKWTELLTTLFHIPIKTLMAVGAAWLYLLLWPLGD